VSTPSIEHGSFGTGLREDRKRARYIINRRIKHLIDVTQKMKDRGEIGAPMHMVGEELNSLRFLLRRELELDNENKQLKVDNGQLSGIIKSIREGTIK